MRLFFLICGVLVFMLEGAIAQKSCPAGSQLENALKSHIQRKMHERLAELQEKDFQVYMPMASGLHVKEVLSATGELSCYYYYAGSIQPLFTIILLEKSIPLKEVERSAKKNKSP